MRNFQDTFETRKWSFISAFSIYMAVPFKRCILIHIRLCWRVSNKKIFAQPISRNKTNFFSFFVALLSLTNCHTFFLGYISHRLFLRIGVFWPNSWLTRVFSWVIGWSRNIKKSFAWKLPKITRRSPLQGPKKSTTHKKV